MSTSTCPACHHDLTADQLFCGRCGTAVAADGAAPADPTIASDREVPEPVLTAGTSDAAGSFGPGTVIADRYRIVSLLGRGGMGEVYRADDLKLARPVALKFLPPRLEQDPSRLARLLSEVRIALSVSHPNVCRVHDIQQQAGRHFITMEFVDGDDLAVLLRRIGRLPPDKALQIARQLCAGLAAAHAAGVLHRDLKPANILIDGRGQVKITDFGLAGLSGGIEPGQVRDGTPAYMAPEQLAGEGVSEASDLYALGLVLYEVYTGKPAYTGDTLAEIRHGRSSAPTSPTSLLADMDPAVERLILRCLEPEPRNRPTSAMAVAAALPGGDPLAAALAAGETPAPGLVAEAGAVGGLKPAVAWALLVAFVALLGLNIAGSERYAVVSRAAPPKSGAVLEEQAREILATLGYDQPFRDSIQEFSYNADYVRHLRAGRSQADVGDAIERPQPPVIEFGYRQSQDWLSYEAGGSVGDWISRSPPEIPGDVRLRLDPQGRLRWLDAAPPERVAADTVAPALAWGSLLAAAGFDEAALTVVEPFWTPSRAFDQRQAWEGAYPDAPDVTVRLEAAAMAGRPVAFRIIEPWTRPMESLLRPLSGPGAQQGIAAVIGPLLWVVSLIAAGVLAWRNVRLGRGDQRTALRFATAVAALRFVWYLMTHHVASDIELNTLMPHLAWTLYRFGLAYCFYLAVEPYARKIWPRMLTAWVRLFDNRFRDPLVGRDVLIGLTVAAAVSAFRWLVNVLAERFGWSGVDLEADGFMVMSLGGLAEAILGVVGTATQVLFPVFMMVMTVLVLRLVLRRDMLTLIPLLFVSYAFMAESGLPTVVTIAVSSILVTAYWLVLFRVGLLAFAIMMLAGQLLQTIPLTFDLGAWWAAPTWLTLFALLAMALWGFRMSLAGQPVFRDRVLEG